MRTICLLLLVLIACQSPAKALDQWGFIDRKGKFVIEPKFFAVTDFEDNNLAKVALFDKENPQKEIWITNREIYEIEKDGSRSTRSKILIAKQLGEGHSYGFVDNQGKIAIEPNFKHAVNFDSEGDASIVQRIDSDHFEMIDRNGKTIKEFGREVDFSRLGYSPWKNGLLSMKAYQNGQAKTLSWDKQGNRVDRVSEYSEGLRPVRSADKTWQYLNQSGELMISLKNEVTLAFPFHDGLAAIVVGNPDTHNAKLGFIDKSGKIAIAPQYNRFDRKSPPEFSSGLAPIFVETPKGILVQFINKHNKVIIPPRFKDAHNFENGLAAVKVGPSGFVKEDWMLKAQINWFDRIEMSKLFLSDHPPIGMRRTEVDNYLGSALPLEAMIKDENKTNAAFPNSVPSNNEAYCVYSSWCGQGGSTFLQFEYDENDRVKRYRFFNTIRSKNEWISEANASKKTLIVPAECQNTWH